MLRDCPEPVEPVPACALKLGMKTTGLSPLVLEANLFTRGDSPVRRRQFKIHNLKSKI
jgi:hypothetical protein